jgi:hypothetical protein
MSDTASRFDRSHFTDQRNQAYANGEDVVIELNITTLDRLDPGEICTLCPTPAAMLVEVWQSYRRDGRDLRDMTESCDPLCADCAGSHSPGVYEAACAWDEQKQDMRDRCAAGTETTWEQVDEQRVAIEVLQRFAPAILAVLGFDKATAVMAVDGIVTRIILATKMTGSRVIGPYIPGGEIAFMPDDADPDGPLGDVSGRF